MLALFPYEYLGGSVSGAFVFLDLHGSDFYTFLSSVFLPTLGEDPILLTRCTFPPNWLTGICKADQGQPTEDLCPDSITVLYKSVTFRSMFPIYSLQASGRWTRGSP